MRLFKRHPQDSPVKPMGIRYTVFPPVRPATFNEWVEGREKDDFDKLWDEFKSRIIRHRTRNK